MARSRRAGYRRTATGIVTVGRLDAMSSRMALQPRERSVDVEIQQDVGAGLGVADAGDAKVTADQRGVAAAFLVGSTPGPGCGATRAA